jgi:outer membrane lipoprotein SlyB
MGKRIMLAAVGAGIGSLAGLVASFLGAGNLALIAGAIAGAILPLVVLGSPGK